MEEERKTEAPSLPDTPRTDAPDQAGPEHQPQGRETAREDGIHEASTEDSNASPSQAAATEEQAAETEPSQEVQEPAEHPEASRLAALEAELEQTRNRLLRIAADFDNYRKRTQKEMARTEERAAEKVLSELLPVLDNLERALEHAGANAQDVEGLRAGVSLVLKQFRDAMAKFGVSPFESKGKPFDPTFHEAVGQVESQEVPAGHVVEEWQRGYLIGDRLMRPALVVVSKEPSSEDEAASDERGEILDLHRESEDATENPSEVEAGETESRDAGTEDSAEAEQPPAGRADLEPRAHARTPDGDD